MRISTFDRFDATPDSVAKHVTRVLASDSPYDSHMAADEMLLGVLYAIVNGHPDPVALATEAVRVDDPDRTIWYG